MGSMGMLRCPTCLTLLVGGEARCPACRSRLRKRSQPIVLGEDKRITSLPQLQLDRDVNDAAKNAESRRRRRVAEATHRTAADTRPFTPPAPRAPEPAEIVAELVWATDPAPETEVQPSPFFATTKPEPDVAPEIAPEPAPFFATTKPEPEPVVAPTPLFASVRPAPELEPEPEPVSELAQPPAAWPSIHTRTSPLAPPAPTFAPGPEITLESEIALDAPSASQPRVDVFDLTRDYLSGPTREEYRPVPSRSQRFIDLTADPSSETEPDPSIELAPERPGAGHGIHEMFEELHRKARAQDADGEWLVPDSDSDTESDAAPTSRALRLSAARSKRRRWTGHRDEPDDS